MRQAMKIFNNMLNSIAARDIKKDYDKVERELPRIYKSNYFHLFQETLLQLEEDYKLKKDNMSLEGQIDYLIECCDHGKAILDTDLATGAAYILFSSLHRTSRINHSIAQETYARIMYHLGRIDSNLSNIYNKLSLSDSQEKRISAADNKHIESKANKAADTDNIVDSVMIEAINIFYQKTINKSDAQALALYLSKNKLFDNSHLQGRLERNNGIIEFKIIIKEDRAYQKDTIKLFKSIAIQIMNDVFSGEKLNIHLCDNLFNTYALVILPESLIFLNKYIKRDNSLIYYSNTVSDAELGKLADFLGKNRLLWTHEVYHFDKVSVCGINSKKYKYTLSITCSESETNDEEYIKRLKGLSFRLYYECFRNELNEIQLCIPWANSALESVKIITHEYWHEQLSHL